MNMALAREDNLDDLNVAWGVLEDASALYGLWPDRVLFQPSLDVMKATIAKGVVMSRMVSCPPPPKLERVKSAWQQNQEELKLLFS